MFYYYYYDSRENIKKVICIKTIILRKLFKYKAHISLISNNLKYIMPENCYCKIKIKLKI